MCAPTQFIALGKNPSTDDEFKSLHKSIKLLKDTADTKFTFRNFNIDTEIIKLVTGPSFPTVKGLRSQLGYIIMVADDEANANIVHYGLRRWKRIKRSVMATEVHAMIRRFDQPYTILNQLSEIIGRKVDIHPFVDSRTLFEVIAKGWKHHRKTSTNRYMGNLRELCERRAA